MGKNNLGIIDVSVSDGIRATRKKGTSRDCGLPDQHSASASNTWAGARDVCGAQFGPDRALAFGAAHRGRGIGRRKPMESVAAGAATFDACFAGGACMADRAESRVRWGSADQPTSGSISTRPVDRLRAADDTTEGGSGVSHKAVSGQLPHSNPSTTPPTHLN